MRILIYPHLLSIGGSQLNAIELAAAVRDLGHHVAIFASESGPLASTIESLGLPLALAPRHRVRPSPPIAMALRRLCVRERIDVVHGYEWPPIVEAFFGPRLCDGVAVGGTVMSMVVAPFIPASVPLVVGTRQIAAATRPTHGAAVDVIEPPVDTRSNCPSPARGAEFRREYTLGDRPLVVVVSRLAASLKLEGLQLSIAAAGKLAATGVRLVIVGDGEARGALEREAAAVNARTGEPTVRLVGELADPRPAYAAADIVLGMGGSALRAMAFAKPLIVLGERGFVTPLTPETYDLFMWQGFYGLGDGTVVVEKLVDLLRPLLLDPHRRAILGDFARAQIEQHFSLTGAARRQVEIYEQWLAGKGDRRPVADAGRTGLQLLTYKLRRKVARWARRQVSEDFNAVDKIAKVASVAGPPV